MKKINFIINTKKHWSFVETITYFIIFFGFTAILSAHGWQIYQWYILTTKQKHFAKEEAHYTNLCNKQQLYKTQQDALHKSIEPLRKQSDLQETAFKKITILTLLPLSQLNNIHITKDSYTISLTTPSYEQFFLFLENFKKNSLTANAHVTSITCSNNICTAHIEGTWPTT